jgi:hypothetical protein
MASVLAVMAFLSVVVLGAIGEALVERFFRVADMKVIVRRGARPREGRS